MIFIACQLLKKIRGQYMDLNVLKIIDLNCTFYCCSEGKQMNRNEKKIVGKIFFVKSKQILCLQKFIPLQL